MQGRGKTARKEPAMRSQVKGGNMTTAQARKGWKAWRKYCQDGLPVVVARSLEPLLSPAKAPRKRRSLSSGKVQAHKRCGRVGPSLGQRVAFFDEDSDPSRSSSTLRTFARANLRATVQILWKKDGVAVRVSCGRCRRALLSWFSRSEPRLGNPVAAWACSCIASLIPPISFVEA